jgi:hydrogenase nickel incorporation protein HypA/HybF
MHEMGIANSIVEAVKIETARYPGSQPRKVGVRIGELQAIDQDALRFCFDAIVRETELEGLQLEIEFCPRRHRCLECGQEFVVRDYQFQCPQCGEARSECISGDELALAYVEVEEYEPSAAGAESTQ